MSGGAPPVAAPDATPAAAPAAGPDAAERFRRADALFDAALDLATGERAAHVARAAAGDAELRADVERLLRAHARAGGFLAEPAAAFGAWPTGPGADGPAPNNAGDDGPLRARLQRALGAAYQLDRRLAAGGMAAVYLARDVRHARAVAVKVLDPGGGPAFGADGGAGRFLAEVRVTAALQHPHVLPLFDSGAGEGLLYYVMPYVEGETLGQRLARERPLPVDEAVRLARAVAGAVAHAHARGVVHRDLKPDNILLDRGGEPVVADFGIALAAANAGLARATRPGISLGTPRYMSPEQAAGDPGVDARTDVYSLGAVLYEMLTGDPPHVASTTAALLAKLRAERPTPARVLRPSVPAHVSAAVDRALEKRPADRHPTVRAFADALADAPAAADGPGLGTPGLGTSGPGATVRRPRPPRRAAAAGAALLLAAGAGAAAWRGRGGADDPPSTRFVIAPLPGGAIGRAPTLTPDGGRLVYPGSPDAGRRLFVRPVDALRAEALAGTEGALGAFVSPDGRRVGFFTSDDRLKTVPIGGGPVTVLAGVFRYSDGSWGPGDRIVLATYMLEGLSWLTADGGAPLRALTRLDAARHETRHAAPLVLDDGATVVFTAERDRGGPVPSIGELAVVTLDPRAAGPAPHTRLGVRGRRAVAVVDGWLLYTGEDGTTLMAVRFDARTRRVDGAPVAVLEHPDGVIHAVTLARNGTLLYTHPVDGNAPVLVDTSGHARPLVPGVRGSFMNPRLSPDGRQLAIQGTSPQGTDVWVYDLASRASRRLTTSGAAIGPTWTPDGRRVVFLSTSGGRDAFWSQPADGSAPAERVVEGDGLFAGTVAPDGRALLFQRQRGDAWGIWSAPLGGDCAAPARCAPRPLVAERFDAYMPAVSPDGRWLAYAANASGRYEVYVRPYPGPGAPVQVSDGGGTEPAWAPDGRRLFYRGDRRMLAATLITRPAFAVAARATLFTDAFDGDMPMPHRNYDVTRDGRHVVAIAAAGDAAPETVVVIGWRAELRARLARGE